MTAPLMVLAVAAALVGLVCEYGSRFVSAAEGNLLTWWLGYTPSLSTGIVAATRGPGEFHLNVAAVSTIVAVVGILLAMYLYLGERSQAERLKKAFNLNSNGIFGSPYKLSYGKFYIDELYDWTVVQPLRLIAVIAAWFDRNVIDGLVNLMGWIPAAAGSLMRSLQMGLVQFYALAMVLGAVILIFARLMYAAG